MIKLKQSIARTLPVMLIDSSDHIAPKVGIAEGSVTVKTSKDGGALTNFTLTDLWTELGQGLYSIDFAAGDLNTVGYFAYLVTAAGCDQYSGMAYVDSFSDYKADVSALALEATAQAIKAKTDNLPVDPADHSGLIAGIGAAGGTLQTQINDVHAITDAKVDANLAAIGVASGKIDTAQDDLDYLKAKESGRWKITGNQLIFYELDGVTPLKTFNLFDSNGNPTNSNPYERVPA